MAQPPVYNRSFSFSSFMALYPTTPLPGNSLDVELSAAKATLDAILTNLALIQNDAGALRDDSVGLAQLSSEVSVGFSTPTVWVTAHAYTAATSTVFRTAGFYRCLVSHTSATFSTDLSAGKWELIANLAAVPLVTAAQIAVTPSGLLTTNTQTSLEALDSGKAATSHTHPSSAITDSTADGRAFLSADLAGQKTLLSLGALAYLNSVAITTLATYWNLTGVLSPAALTVSTNDWAPTGIAAASRIRCSSTGAINITGMLAPAQDGTRIIIENIGATNVITLTAQDASSAAANRFQMPRPVALRPYQSIEFEYDLTTAVWRPMAPTVSLPVAGGFKNLKVVNGATPNSQVTVTADALTLEDAAGDSYRATSVNVTISNLTLGAINGLDTGANAINTWYAVWILYNPTTNTVGGVISTSATAPTLPSGYTFKTRVGWMLTDATASPNCKFHRILQYGRTVQYTVVAASPTANYPKIADGADGTYSRTAPTFLIKSTAAFVPTTAFRINIIGTAVYGNNAAAALLVAPAGTTVYTGPAGATNPPPGSLGAADGMLNIWMTLETANIYWTGNGAGSAIFCAGWEDNI